MKITVSCRFVIAAAWASAMLGAHVAAGQETKSSAEGQDESRESANKRQLDVMRRFADTIRVTVGKGDESKETQLIPKPLFRFSDPSRLHSDGSVWAWGATGRPVAMSEFRTEDRDNRVWGQWLVATSAAPVSAEIDGLGRWAPREPDFKLQPVPPSPPPHGTKAGRLRQMKQFARRLSASEVWQGQRYELRLLPTEVYRYSDKSSRLVDGAAFLFVVGNNPEAILFVEANKRDSGPGAPGSWKYALASMSAAAVTFQLDETEVWAIPQSFGGPNATYYAFTRAVPAARATDVDFVK